jgi:hypothetical protein
MQRPEISSADATTAKSYSAACRKAALSESSIDNLGVDHYDEHSTGKYIGAELGAMIGDAIKSSRAFAKCMDRLNK